MSSLVIVAASVCKILFKKQTNSCENSTPENTIGVYNQLLKSKWQTAQITHEMNKEAAVSHSFDDFPVKSIRISQTNLGIQQNFLQKTVGPMIKDTAGSWF